MNDALDLSRQIGPITVTLVYVTLYYLFQVHVLRAKTRLAKDYAERGEKFDRYFGQDRTMLAADRVQLNTLEHMGPFLVLLWLNAVFVGPLGATIAGGVYVAARGAYPLLMGSRLGRGVRASIALSTAPGYGVIAYLAGALIWALATAG